MNLYSDCETLDIALRNLSIPNEREKSSGTIRLHVEHAARELSLDKFIKFESELYHQIFQLVRSENLNDIKGGIRVIRELVDGPTAAAEGKVIKFSNSLRNALKSNTDFGLLGTVCLFLSAEVTCVILYYVVLLLA